MIYHDRGLAGAELPTAKFATQVDPHILVQVRSLAHQEGRQLQALIEGALAIQADQIERHGGSLEIFDLGQLEAALFRPQTGYYGDGDSIDEAAALHGRCQAAHEFTSELCSTQSCEFEALET